MGNNMGSHMGSDVNSVGSDQLMSVRPLEPVVSGQLANFAIEYAAIESGALTIELEPAGQFTVSPASVDVTEVGDTLNLGLRIVSTSGRPGECVATFRLRFATRVCVFQVDVP